MTTSLPSLRHIGVAAVAALSVMATSAQASNVNLKSFLECRSTKLVNFPGTIVDAAIATPELSTLVNLVVSANLVGALSAPGNLTVYAPTNDAFASLLAELGVTKAQLLANTELLTTVLTYHVLDSEVRAEDINFPPSGEVELDSVEGRSFMIIQSPLSIDDGAAERDNANIVIPDVLASNGVVHVIDKVILPGAEEV